MSAGGGVRAFHHLRKLIRTVNAKTDIRLSEEFFQRTGLAADFGSAARLGIYVHVPFCPHICPYCDFVKTSRFSGADVKTYFRHLEQQFDALVENIPDTIRCATLYLGGGTPSLFSARYYERLVEKVRARFTLVEFTVETNPYTNAETGLQAFAELGVDRVTLGAQSLSHSALKYLGRKHTPEHVFQSVKAAISAGIAQVQVDLIFGLKKLSENRLIEEEIRQLSDAGATGVSCYLLTIEQSTAFKAESTAIDEEIVDEYSNVLRACEQLGYIQFETSNFSRTAPIHNRLYWYGLPYLGLGTGAHGLLPAQLQTPFGRRYSVGQVPMEKRTGDDQLRFADGAESLFQPCWDEGIRTLNDYREEMVFTLLRTQHGIPLTWFTDAFSQSARQQLWNNGKISRAERDGLLIRDEHHIRLAPHEKIRGDSWAVQILTELQRASIE